MAVEPGDEIDVFYLDEAIPNGDAQVHRLSQS